MSMRAFLATTLGLIAVGVLLIAYGLLAPHAAATPAGASSLGTQTDPYLLARSMSPSDVNEAGRAAADVTSGQLQLDCEPGQRASIREIAGRTSAVCIDAAPSWRREPYGRTSLVERVSETGVPVYERVRPYRVSRVSSVHRSGGRDWRRTALVIGGSSAVGAGLGGIFGGKTGALIGAAIGGGASTLYEAARH